MQELNDKFIDKQNIISLFGSKVSKLQFYISLIFISLIS